MLQKHVYSIHFMATLHKVWNWSVPEITVWGLRNSYYCWRGKPHWNCVVYRLYFISDAFYAESFMPRKMLHPPAHPSSSFNYGAPVKPQAVGPRTSHPLQCLMWLWHGSISQNHLAHIHDFLDADTGKLLAKHHTICEVKENFFIRVS